jgi:hypothetical protein
MASLAALGAGCGAKSSDPPKKPAAAALSLSFPTTTVGPGIEATQCVTLRLGNTAPVHIGAVHNTLGLGSHHMIVYRVTDTVESPAPTPCQPFTDTLDATKGSPLMITQKSDDLLTLPQGVAYSLDVNQMIRIELHYLNPASTEQSITASTTMIPISDDDFKDEADFLFIGNPDIRLAPHAEGTLGPTFFPIPEELADVKFFAMTGHEHKLGTNVQVATAAGASDVGPRVYDVADWKWSEPATVFFDAPVKVPANGGFSFTCTWNNTTDQTVHFGESVNDEMCFFWAYYYPSQGAKVCFHTTATSKDNPLDICCPDHPLCNLVNAELKKVH